MGVLEFRQQYGKLQEYRASVAATTASTLIASAARSDTRIMIVKLIFSQAAAGYFALQSGTNLIGPATFNGANGGIALDEPDICASEGAGLYWKSDIAGSHVLFMKYAEVGLSG